MVLVQGVGCFFEEGGKVIAVFNVQPFHVELPAVEVVLSGEDQHHIDGPFAGDGGGDDGVEDRGIEPGVYDEGHHLYVVCFGDLEDLWVDGAREDPFFAHVEYLGADDGDLCGIFAKALEGFRVVDHVEQVLRLELRDCEHRLDKQEEREDELLSHSFSFVLVSEIPLCNVKEIILVYRTNLRLFYKKTQKTANDHDRLWNIYS